MCSNNSCYQARRRMTIKRNALWVMFMQRTVSAISPSRNFFYSPSGMVRDSPLHRRVLIRAVRDLGGGPLLRWAATARSADEGPLPSRDSHRASSRPRSGRSISIGLRIMRAQVRCCSPAFQLLTNFAPMVAPLSTLIMRDNPLPITILPGGGSLARARLPPSLAILVR